MSIKRIPILFLSESRIDLPMGPGPSSQMFLYFRFQATPQSRVAARSLNYVTEFGAEFVTLRALGPMNVCNVTLQGDIGQVVMKRAAKGRRQFVACRLQ